MEECKASFERLKTYLATMPLLTWSIMGETLYLYLAISSRDMSSMLIREEIGAWKLGYYISQILKDIET